MAAKPRSAPCPRCSQRASLDQANAWRPFCSERCKMIDLGKWAAEEYAIPAQEESPSSEAPEDPAHRRH
ncbi:MAG TPA: DNA gyrase inhibitor YacG [Nevskiaceae bacterium]|nr:DNA gyrase inhibitor YacG [Nevskiaceae bacterium]